MASQIGVVKLRGTLHETTFYKNVLSKKGTVARSCNKRYLRERALKDKRYEAFRMEGHIHGYTSAMCGIIRECLYPIIFRLNDRKMNTRLTSTTKPMVRKASIEGRNENPFHTDGLDVLKRFSFNEKTSIIKALPASYEIATDEENRYLRVKKPQLLLVEGCSHYRLISSVAGINFETKEMARNDSVSKYIAANDKIELIELVTEIPEGYPVYFQILGLRRFDFVSDEYKEMGDHRGNAADILDVWRG